MFATLRAKTWADVIARTAPLHLWGFRGQSDSAWPLESTLIRVAQQCGCNLSALNHREYWMRRQFERRAFDYLENQPLPSNKLDWLALMQHYGSPTRLLDFSHSFYVAAFFAMEQAQGDAAVWGVNTNLLGEKIATVMGVSLDDENIDEQNSRHMKYLEQFLGLQNCPETPMNLVVPVEPDRLHRRLTAQQGFFLCPTNLLVSFEHNLLATLDLDPSSGINPREVQWDEFQENLWEYGAIKIVLPRKIHKQALEDLHRMNISAATLFPGLDGFARSMRFHVRNMGR